MLMDFIRNNWGIFAFIGGIAAFCLHLYFQTQKLKG